ncbi:hypothetical protein HF086_001556 [Spodoptera exigua]|uniref:Uncharacterized protein n=1 Tax=Spodoptera exigua TaxID=7107 RepID=A0A922SL61_SPOEX|nr:hypothetical protein HF086_001556 [Spodoptera exigua]
MCRRVGVQDQFELAQRLFVPNMHKVHRCVGDLFISDGFRANSNIVCLTLHMKEMLYAWNSGDCGVVHKGVWNQLVCRIKVKATSEFARA